MTNFGLQIPLFALGYIKLFFWWLKKIYLK
jgi:hypothetical protein